MSASKSKSQAETDLELARERLSFYEQFDEIIRQNIASSSALLKEASARLDGDLAAERVRYRALLADVLDELGVMQSQSERLARRVTEALDALEHAASAPANPPEERPVAPLATEAPPEATAVVNAAVASKRKPAERASAPLASTATPSSIPTGRPSDPPAPAPTQPPAGDAPRTSTTVLVHGVPRASAALGLKSHIEKLDFVSTVEPREFAAGLLRLQVDGARPLALDDLAGWNLADRIILRNASNDLLEIDLTPA